MPFPTQTTSSLLHLGFMNMWPLTRRWPWGGCFMLCLSLLWLFSSWFCLICNCAPGVTYSPARILRTDWCGVRRTLVGGPQPKSMLMMQSQTNLSRQLKVGKRLTQIHFWRSEISSLVWKPLAGSTKHALLCCWRPGSPELKTMWVFIDILLNMQRTLLIYIYILVINNVSSLSIMGIAVLRVW